MAKTDTGGTRGTCDEQSSKSDKEHQKGKLGPRTKRPMAPECIAAKSSDSRKQQLEAASSKKTQTVNDTEAYHSEKQQKQQQQQQKVAVQQEAAVNDSNIAT